MIPMMNVIEAVERNLKHAKGFDMTEIDGNKYVAMSGSEILIPIGKFPKDKLFFPLFLSNVRDGLFKTNYVRLMPHENQATGKKKIIVHDKGIKVYEYPWTVTGAIDALNKAADIYERKERRDKR